jgi:thiol-disulfide isomerase/thioredoxin
MWRRGRGRALIWWWLTAGLMVAGTGWAGEANHGTTHALLINGGSKPASNYLSHLHHLQEMVEVLEARGIPRKRIHIFSADGEEAGADLAVRDTKPGEFWLIEGTRVGNSLRPRTEVTDTRWAGVNLRPARKEALREWFEGARARLSPGDELLLFVTDHGTKNADDLDNGAISLWQEELSVEDLRELLAWLQPGVRVVMVMSQCYSGTFANLISDGKATDAAPDVCGFFSTSRDLPAYGCYPEGRDRDRLGHAFQFIDALRRQGSTTEAHLEVLVTDDTPDIPLRTSDFYLERLLADDAKDVGLAFDAFVDALLAEAWQERAAWEPEIRLLDRIGEVFGTFSPRTLAEIDYHGKQLSELVEQMKTYADRWQTTLVSAKERNLRSFMSERPEWKGRLDEEALKGLDADRRKAVLDQLLPVIQAFTRQNPGVLNRLDVLRDRAQSASEARWRLDVRKAALERMRAVLVGVAGRVLLDAKSQTTEEDALLSAREHTLDGLLSCEAFAPGTPSVSPQSLSVPAIEPYPPMSAEIDLLSEVLPSWLGVRFGSVPAAVRTSRDIAEGPAMLQAVYPDSPALEAGLEVGDIILGPPDRPFEAPGQLREWTMLSPRNTALPLRVIRPAVKADEDLEFEATLYLRAYPMEWPELPGPPQVGDVAPTLPSALQSVGTTGLPEISGRSHLLFFWATWCLRCKRAVPEVLAFAAAKGLPVLAISDENLAKVEHHLEEQQEAFFDHVAIDTLRKSFIAYGVSGIPTILIIDEQGVVRFRQVGYSPDEGLNVEDWNFLGS